MNNVLVYHNVIAGNRCCVILCGEGQYAHLSPGEAYALADEVRARWPELAHRLDEAAEGVHHVTRFDGPLPGVDPFEGEPGNVERARQIIGEPGST